MAVFDPEKKFRFRKFRAYADAREFSRRLKTRTAELFPSHEKFGLRSQLWRAADSVILNIAEGSERGTDRDFAHFLNISLASLNEVVASLDIATDQGYFSTVERDAFIERAALLANQISAFRRTLLGADRQRSNVKR